MSQRINYFVGPYGSGKTSIVTNLANEFTTRYLTVTEDEDMIWFFKQPSILNMELSYLNIIFYKIKRAITNAKLSKKDILVDGHPLLALIYGRTFFETEHGQTISFPEWGLLNKAHTRLYNYAYKSGMFNRWDQTIYYLNIKYAQNWKNVVERGRVNMNEQDEWYLQNLRRILHQEIYGLAEFYKCDLEEINSLEDIKKFF